MRNLLTPAIVLMLGLVAPALAAEPGGDAKPETRKPPVHKITQSESYIMIDPIYTSIMDGDRPLGLLMIGIGLDIPNSELRQKATDNMPMLRDAYVRTLMSFTATSVRYWRQPDVAEIADRLQRVTDRALGRAGARILLAQVAMRLEK